MENIQRQLRAAKQASLQLGQCSNAVRKDFLLRLAELLRAQVATILLENLKDLELMDLADSRYDRLLLDEARVYALADAVLELRQLEDPTGKLLATHKLDNGLLVEKKTVALGVVAVIYESRPNVTVDVAALCIRSGNVCLLRGGSDAWHTNTVLVKLIQAALSAASIDPDSVQLLPTDRAFVTELLTATAYVDIIIPRGSQALIDRVRAQATVPVIETGAGVCHTYVEASADLEKAAKIVANAKISRPSVCNALDTILVDKQIATDFLQRLLPYFKASAVEIFAEEPLYSSLKQMGYPWLQQAQEADFGREFLDLKCSIRAVSSLEEALAHISTHSSKHSECIVSENATQISTFMNSVDAAAVYANASTRFTDGGMFGLGAEIGISTQKLHARGPFALEKLVSEKWYVTGDGQIRE